MTPAQLRRQAAYLRGRAEGELARATRQAERIQAQAEVLERAAAEMEALRRGEQGHTVVNMLTDPAGHALATSRGKNPSDGLLVAARAAEPTPFTLRSLAAAVDMSPAALSMARKGKKPIRKGKAESIARLTGFAATPENWPGGIIE
jgi:hypothetical protein